MSLFEAHSSIVDIYYFLLLEECPHSGVVISGVQEELRTLSSLLTHIHTKVAQILGY